jgi:hypothetical protein
MSDGLGPTAQHRLRSDPSRRSSARRSTRLLVALARRPSLGVLQRRTSSLEVCRAVLAALFAQANSSTALGRGRRCLTREHRLAAAPSASRTEPTCKHKSKGR